MQPFKVHSGIAAPLPIANIDTDMIIPKLYLRTIKRTGLGIHAFDEMRYLTDGQENPDFVLNREPYRQASILITGENFGCGSSREHAPWALGDFGLRCIISTSFADIFFNNCFKNGILPVSLPKAQIDQLTEHATNTPETEITVDLVNQQVKAGNHVFDFDIEPFRKHCLINGLDDIGLTLQDEPNIGAYEENLSQDRPWILS